MKNSSNENSQNFFEKKKTTFYGDPLKKLQGGKPRKTPLIGPFIVHLLLKKNFKNIMFIFMQFQKNGK
jgi:hypothetical protein